MSSHIPTPSLAIAPIPKSRLRECAELSRDAFGSTELETPAPGELYTTVLSGGVLLGAFHGRALVGVVSALPGFDATTPHLYVTSLCVRRSMRNHRVGRRLRWALHEEARNRGDTCIRWTANPMSGVNMRLYLAHCGARLVSYHPMLYAGLYARVRATGVAGDEVGLIWDVPIADGWRRSDHGSFPPDGAIMTRTASMGGDRRRLVGYAISPDSSRTFVEIPWDGRELERCDVGAATTWRAAVRHTITQLIRLGYAGTDALADRSRHRTFLQFDLVGHPPR